MLNRKPRKHFIKSGDKFNDWTVIKEVKGRYCRMFLCVNSRGLKREVNMRHLLSGASKGYFNSGERGSNYKHGMTKTRQHIIWVGMKRRCLNKNDSAYINYGGRGIRVCKKWMTFNGFWEDMKEGYSDKLTLERIDVNGNYTKKNCKWIPREMQSKNTRANVIINGHKLFELAEKNGINYNTLYGRIFTYKMPVSVALRKGRIKRGSW